MADDVKNIVIFDWGDVTASVRTRASGKERVTLEIRGDPLVINTDEKALMKPVAEALAAEIQRNVRTHYGFAKPSTQAARDRAAKAYEAGKAWARRRYSGGRIGPLPPNQTKRLLVDSGRLAKSIAVGVTNAKEYVVNVAANRLGPESLVRSRTLTLLRPIIAAAMRSDAAKMGVEKAARMLVQRTRAQRSELFGRLKETLAGFQSLGNAVEKFEEPEEEP